MKELVASKDGIQLLDLVAEFSGFLSYPKLEQLAKHMQCMIMSDESDDRRRTARRDDPNPDPHAVGRGSDQGEAVAARQRSA